MKQTTLKRCAWAGTDPLYMSYHDKEWGVPLFDDRKLFEFIVLEGAQAGLSWITILKKRNNYRRLFDNFNPKKMILYDAAKLNTLINNKGIVRNRLKIKSAIQNAGAFLNIVNEFGNFSSYIWQFVDGKPIQNEWSDLSHIPAETKISTAMSKNLKKRGFTFVGPKMCYAFMQAVGMVNDHTIDCFRYHEVNRLTNSC